MLRAALLVATLLLSAGVFVDRVSRHAPMQTWLFFRYAICWVFVAVFSAACVAVGHLIVRALAPSGLELRDHLVLAFAAGVLAFAIELFIAPKPISAMTALTAGLMASLNVPFGIALGLLGERMTRRQVDDGPRR